MAGRLSPTASARAAGASLFNRRPHGAAKQALRPEDENHDHKSEGIGVGPFRRAVGDAEPCDRPRMRPAPTTPGTLPRPAMSATAKPSMIISDPTKGVTGKSAMVSAPPSPAIALP